MTQEEIDQLPCPLCGATDAWSPWSIVHEARYAVPITGELFASEAKVRHCTACRLVCNHGDPLGAPGEALYYPMPQPPRSD